MDDPAYDPHSRVTPLTAAELEGLERSLLQMSEKADQGVMSLDGLDGYLTAIAVAPAALLVDVPSGDWLPLIWGGDSVDHAPAPFASRRRRKDTVVLVMRHLRHISHQLQADSQAWEPIFSIAEQGANEWVDARDWCAGFLQAVDLLPSLWDGLFDDPERHCIVRLGGGLDGIEVADGNSTEIDLEDPASCDALSRLVPDAVLQLRAAADHPAGIEAAGGVPADTVE
ncbi:MAG: UPF0149 family protein [Rubrivivax sp.]